MSFPGTPVLVKVPAGTTYLRVYLHDGYPDGLAQRHYGPTLQGRFDHHPAGEPRRAAHHGIGCVATTFRCAVAEVFGTGRHPGPRRGRARCPHGGAAHPRPRSDPGRRTAPARADGGAGDPLRGWHTEQVCVARWERARPTLGLWDDRSLTDLDELPELRLLATELHDDVAKP